MRFLPLLVLILAITFPLKAQIFSDNVTLQPGYNVTLSVIASSNVTMSPGNYKANSWVISGRLILNGAGNYVIEGSANLSGGITGPTSGTATIRFVNSLLLTSAVPSNVTILQGAAPVDPPVVTPPVVNPPTVTPPAVAPGVSAAAPLVNISTRIALASGQVLTPGFVVGGTTSKRVLLRAIGPGLTAFGVSGAAQSPSLTVFSGQTQIASNSGWGGNSNLSAVFSGVGAFALPAGSNDAALLLTLSPGNYTARVTGVGEVLLEIYFVD